MDKIQKITELIEEVKFQLSELMLTETSSGKEIAALNGSLYYLEQEKYMLETMKKMEQKLQREKASEEETLL